jgi:hypothetical protein
VGTRPPCPPGAGAPVQCLTSIAFNSTLLSKLTLIVGRNYEIDKLFHSIRIIKTQLDDNMLVNPGAAPTGGGEDVLPAPLS